MSVIAIIPARGGSKSIPFKNIHKLAGKPLIEYTIDTALKSKKIDKIIVSTDSNEIINTVSKYNGVIVLKRPDYLSTDESSTESCLLHVLDTLNKDQNYIPKIVLTLEPTSPFRSLKTINDAIKKLSSGKVDSVIGVKETKVCFGKIFNNKFEHFIKNQPRRRQDRKSIFIESSTLYGTLTQTLIKNNSVLGDNPFPIVVNELESIDINEPLDIIYAEAVLKYLNKKK